MDLILRLLSIVSIRMDHIHEIVITIIRDRTRSEFSIGSGDVNQYTARADENPALFSIIYRSICRVIVEAMLRLLNR